MSNNFPLPKGYRNNIHKADNNVLSSRQGLIGKVVTEAGVFHRLFVPNPLRGWKSLTLSAAITPHILSLPPITGIATCFVFICEHNTPDSELYNHLVDVIDFSSKDKIYSYYRAPISLSEYETIIVQSNTTGVCVRAEGNDDSRFNL